MHTIHQQHIVIAGSGNLAIATYQTLAKEFSSEINKGKIRISIISANEYFEHPDLFGEIIVGRLEKHAIACPLASIAKEASLLYGEITAINRKSQVLEVKLNDGGRRSVYYDHLVLDSNGSGSPSQSNFPAFVQTISCFEEARQLCHHLDKIVRKAAGLRNPEAAGNMLRFVLLIHSERDLAIATYISKYLADSCSRYYNLKGITPGIFLVESDYNNRLSDDSPATRNWDKILSGMGIRWIKDGVLQQFTAEGVQLDNGGAISCSLIMHFNHGHRFVNTDELFTGKACLNGSADDFLRVNGERHIWTGDTQNSGYMDVASGNSQGKHIARNIMLAIGSRFLQKYKAGRQNFRILLFPQTAQVVMPGFSITNKLAWYFQICYLLFKLPMRAMSKNGLINLISHFIWKKTKIETGLVHYRNVTATAIRAAS